MAHVMKSRPPRFLWVIVPAALVLPAHAAQALRDPMRPPPGFAATDNARPRSVEEPVLQSVMISPGRRAAIISGEVVRLGEKFGGARLVRVSEQEVVLQYGTDARVLKLYPAVDKDALGAGGGSARAPGRVQDGRTK